jgi:hypothetical protein
MHLKGETQVATLIDTKNGKASQRDLKVGLFIPCYIDLIYPEVGVAT